MRVVLRPLLIRIAEPLPHHGGGGSELPAVLGSEAIEKLHPIRCGRTRPVAKGARVNASQCETGCEIEDMVEMRMGGYHQVQLGHPQRRELFGEPLASSRTVAIHHGAMPTASFAGPPQENRFPKAGAVNVDFETHSGADGLCPSPERCSHSSNSRWYRRRSALFFRSAGGAGTREASLSPIDSERFRLNTFALGRT